MPFCSIISSLSMQLSNLSAQEIWIKQTHYFGADEQTAILSPCKFWQCGNAKKLFRNQRVFSIFSEKNNRFWTTNSYCAKRSLLIKVPNIEKNGEEAFLKILNWDILFWLNWTTWWTWGHKMFFQESFLKQFSGCFFFSNAVMHFTAITSFSKRVIKRHLTREGKTRSQFHQHFISAVVPIFLRQ